MSDLTPFDGGVPSVEHADIFKPDLSGFDFVAYEGRQAELDATMRSQGDLAASVRRHHGENPEIGVMLNNLHDTQISGELPRGMNARLAVVTRSTIDATMRDVSMRGAVGPAVDFSGATLIGGELTDVVLPRVSFRGANLRGVNLVNSVLSGGDFTGADLTGANLTGAYLVGARGLTPEQLRKADIRAIRMIGENAAQETDLREQLAGYFTELGDDELQKLIDPVPVSIDQRPGKLQAGRMLKGLYVHEGVWNNVDFTDATLIGAIIDGLVAKQVSLRGAAMSGAIITRALMPEADFVQTWIPGAIFEGVDLRGANFTGANLVGALFNDADLRNVQGLGAKGSNTNGIVIDETSLLPQGYGYEDGRLQLTVKKQHELEQ